MRRVAIALLFTTLAFGQRHKLGVVDSGVPEGQLLQQIGQENDEAKKLALMEQFAVKFPAHEAAPWVYTQIQAAYLKANQFDKAIEAGEKVLKADPADAEVAHQNLKAAEGKNDPALIIKWSGETAQAAQKMLASTQPKEESEVDEWKREMEFSKQVVAYTEYSLYATALKVQDPKQQAELIEALEQRNPNSQYLAQARTVQFNAYLRMQDMGKALAVAEKVLATDQSNEDMLLVAAGSYLDKKTEPDKVMSYTGKVVELMATKPVPQGVSEADWARRKGQLTGRAYWIQGKQYFNQKKLKEADKTLREALPLVDDQNLKADTLFHLGVINYNLQNIMDALKFNEQCAAIKSPYQAAAQKNVRAIRGQYREVR